MPVSPEFVPGSYTAQLDRDTLKVFEVAEPEFDPHRHANFAKELGIRAKPQEHAGLLVTAQNSRFFAHYPSSGAMWAGDFTKLHNPEYEAEVPSSRKSLQIASEYLREQGLLTEGRPARRVTEGTFERVEGEGRRTQHKWLNHRCVNLTQQIDGLECHGPGARTKVYIGSKGEILGMYHAPMRAKDYGEFPHRSERNMRRLLAAKLGVSLRKVELVRQQLVYHAESIVDFTRFVHPVYVYTLAGRSRRQRRKSTAVEFELHPIPATTFAPVVTLEAPREEVAAGSDVTMSCAIDGGTPPYRIHWESPIHGRLGDGKETRIHQIAAIERRGHLIPHTIRVTVVDANGMWDTHQVSLNVVPTAKGNVAQLEPVAGTFKEWGGANYVGVEWCNIYNGAPGLADISGTDDSALGFGDYIKSLSGWERRFAWGNNAAWEQDFKFATAPGGGTDTNWADNVHFAFFAGHGSSGNFYFGSTVDDHTMEAQHARWGDGMLNWIVLHACQTMRNNFAWTDWCDAFEGLHEMFGFHTNTQGSTPPLGSRFAFWSSFQIPIHWPALDLRTAWKVACTECFGSHREYAVIYAGQSGTDTHNDHLPGYGHVSADPTSPNYWVYYKGSC
jgi:hypothetical protein